MKLYTIYNDDGFFWGEYHIEKPINATERIYTGSYIKPKYSIQADNFYESATTEEIEDANRLRVPQTASKMRFFLALLDMNITRTMVYDVINQIPDATLKEIVLIKFDLSQEFDRNDEHLIMLANEFNITEDQLDNLFIQANE